MLRGARLCRGARIARTTFAALPRVPVARLAAPLPRFPLRLASTVSNQPPPEAIKLTEKDISRLQRQRNIGISAHIGWYILY